jgi:hypothetical protein
MIKLHVYKHLNSNFSVQKDQAPVVYNDVSCAGRCCICIVNKGISLNFNQECVNIVLVTACIFLYYRHYFIYFIF